MPKEIIGIVDYKAGNLKSVDTALKHIGARRIISGDADVLLKTDKLIFPGVGSAGAAMDALKERGLDKALIEYASSGRLILGICIGCQILLESSEERNTSCLSLIKGEVKLFPSDMGLKVPHMGWNQVFPTMTTPLFKDIPGGTSFYFVHSYYPQVRDEENQLCSTEYGITFSSGIVKDNLFAVQFHPEKSGEFGLLLLKNFLAMG